MADSPPAELRTFGDGHNMARTYSAEELLKMRETLPFVICDINKLNPDIGLDILKVPEDIRSGLKSKARSTRELSSAILSSRNSRLLHDSEQSCSEISHCPRSPDDQEDVVLFRGKLDLQSQEQKKMWLLRKRGGSDRPGQPFPAPSGFEAQKADNFKKFYAAVISPTHLRVTAGGRIVPNTRGLPHHTFTWNAEKQFFEPADRPFNTSLERQGSWLSGTNLNATDPCSPLGIVRPAIGNFFGPPLHSQAPANTGTPLDNKSTHSTVAPASVVEKLGSENNGASDEGNITQSQVKISPPSQFDLSRPFSVNGQPFYPAPPGFQVPTNVPVLPFNMLCNPNVPYQSFVPQHGIISSHQMQFQAGNFYLPQQMTLDGQHIGQQGPPMQIHGFTSPAMAPHLHAPIGQPFGAVSMLPPTSLHEEPVAMIPQAVMLGHQIQALQQQLKHCENQLQNNKHQVDEQHVMYQQNHVQNQIRALQSGLGLQGFQPAFCPHDQYAPSMWNLGTGTMGIPLASVTNLEDIAGKTDGPESGLVGSSGYQSTVQGKPVTENSEALGAQSSSIGGSNSQNVPARQPLTGRTRLSAAAAMAPEFQPRSQLTIVNQSGAVKPSIAAVATHDDSGDLKKATSPGKVEPRLLSNVTNWSTPGQWANSVLTHVPASVPSTHTVHHLNRGIPFNHTSANHQAQTSLKFSTGNVQDISPATQGINPYLTGTPPPGMPVNNVKSSDFVYSRELTEEELRARQLYWGKAPRDLSKGLPKFDGKDFYPPSPEKSAVAQVSQAEKHSSQQFETSHRSRKLSPAKLNFSNTTITSRCEPGELQDSSQVGDGFDKPSIYKAAANGGSSMPEDDTISTGSWGITKTEEEEVFSHSAHRTSIFNERQSGFDHTTFVKPKPFGLSLANLEQGQPTLLKDMLRNSPRTTMAAPTGALSSATAHGYLPQYGGTAVASLTPSVSNITASPLAHNHLSSTGRSKLSIPALVENQPLSSPSPLRDFSSAATLLKKVKGKEKETLDPGFNPNAKGIGPVYDGSDW